MKKIFIAYGHHNTNNSFNSAIRDTFIEEAEKLGHKIDLLNLFDEKEQLPFYNQNVNPPPKLVLDYRKRLEAKRKRDREREWTKTQDFSNELSEINQFSN